MNAIAHLCVALICCVMLLGSAGPGAARTQTTIICKGCVIVTDPDDCKGCIVVNKPVVCRGCLPRTPSQPAIRESEVETTAPVPPAMDSVGERAERATIAPAAPVAVPEIDPIAPLAAVGNAAKATVIAPAEVPEIDPIRSLVTVRTAIVSPADVPEIDPMPVHAPVASNAGSTDSVEWTLAAFDVEPPVIADNAVSTLVARPDRRRLPRGGIAVGRMAGAGDDRNCLATAIYFEARGETRAGQRAVAQVILNRVRDRHFPRTVCDVVYQNQERPNRCQFSFACDGRPEDISEAGAWRRALLIAADTLERFYAGRLVEGPTHYHTASVQPVWSHSLQELYRVGAHVFYRVEPRAATNGS